MARIRTIKPEFWASEQIGECSSNARLLFIGLWNFADDFGVHPDKPKELKAKIFPYDDATTNQVRGWIDELVQQALLRRFDANDATYLFVTGWEKHQKIDKPNKEKRHPDPNKFAEHSPIIPGLIDDPSRRSRVEGKGKEGKGVERSRARDAAEASPGKQTDTEPEFAAEKVLALIGSPNLFRTERVGKWLAEGYDLDRDILPAIKARMAERRAVEPEWFPQSLGYFDGVIAEAIAARTKPMPKRQSHRMNGVAQVRPLSVAEQSKFVEKWGLQRAPRPELEAKVQAEGLSEQWVWRR